MKQRFDELLPFYANGTLTAAERSWVDSYLLEHPQARAELQWVRSLQSRLDEDMAALPGDAGLARTLARIRAEAPAPALAGATRPRSAPGPGPRFAAWLQRLLPQPMLAPALAAALVVVVAQGLLIVRLAGSDDEHSQIRSAPSAAVVAAGPYLKVNFKPEARENEIRLLLVQADATLAGGPGQLGDWYLRVAPARLEVAAQQLRASAIVEAVATVDALPARP